MNRAELIAALEADGFSRDSYNVGDEEKTEVYTLKYDASGIVGRPASWSVFYSEKGLRTGEQVFQTEALACDYFLDLIRRDPIAKTA